MSSIEDYRRVARPLDKSFFVFGPRGTGKSTWLNQQFADTRRIDLLDEATYQSYLTAPHLLAAELRTIPRGGWVVIDEVQRLPNLLSVAHQLIEERRLRFVLCGSSARKLRREGTNLLGGRAGWLDFFPLLPEELGRDFSVLRALSIGTIPLICRSPKPHETLAAYARLYLREEIQNEALVRNLSGFARFLPIASLFHAQVLNAASLARDAGVSRTTVLGYLGVLEDTLIAFQLPAFEAKLRVRERKHPKLYLFDPGVVRALRGPVEGAPVHEELGALFEGLVAGVLRAYQSMKRLFDDWAYWAPAEARRTEVDFLLRRKKDFLAVEAKAGQALANADLAGLRAIADLPRVVRRILVCQAARPRRTADGIDVLPFGVFAEQVAAGELWP